MRILAVDDERPALFRLTQAIRQAQPGAEVHAFTKYSEAITDVREHNYRADVAFLDIELQGKTGLELAAVLKVLHPKVNIIFVTGFSQYATDALELRPSGYVMKPATMEKITVELQNLRYPPARTRPEKPIQVQCFGAFEVFHNGTGVHFSRARAKEILAFLVDRRGAACTAAELAAILWDDGLYDRSRQKQCSTFQRDLMADLRQVGAEDIIIKEKNTIAVDPSKFDCDYYAALAGDIVAINAYMGEYLSQYSWAELTSASLSRRLTKA